MNFVQKSLREYMSVSFQSRTRGIEKLIQLKYDIVLKWENTFNLGFNTTTNTHHTKKASSKSCSELNFVPKSPRAHMSTTPGSGAGGIERLACSKNYYVRKHKLHLI